jgi:predicted lipoprotein
MEWVKIIDEHGLEIPDTVAGDPVWDIMTEAIENIVINYYDTWCRPPSKLEMKLIFDYCMATFDTTVIDAGKEWLDEFTAGKIEEWRNQD